MATQSPEKARGEEGGGRALSSNPVPEQFKSRVLKFACIYIIFNKIYIMTLPTNANW